MLVLTYGILTLIYWKGWDILAIEFENVGARIRYLEENTYDKNDLGLTYSPESSTFKVWSPLAESVELCLYETGEIRDASLIEKISMEQKEGVWQVVIQKDLKDLFYTYRFSHPNRNTQEALDLYSKAVGVNGDRTAIIDLTETNPSGWEEDFHVMQPKITDSIIWETHVADFSSDPNGGFSSEVQGKYLAFTALNTTVYNAGDFPTGVNYLKHLGVNYVHLLPVFDFDNDESDTHYGWGYDPKNYMVPEGRYSSDPTNPYVRIKEFKQMVQSLHQAEIGVVLDVVYNHTFKTDDSWFQMTVPDYYYRQNKDGTFANGSGTGNETGSERKMMRKYMVESILYWAKEYHLDGFRFDLMGLHDVDTMNAIRKALDDEDLENVILYGEPWNAGSVAIFEPNKPADKYHIQEFKEGIAVFNDEFRDAIKGPVFDKYKGGFLQGANGREDSSFMDGDLISAITANTQEDVGSFSLPEEKAWAKDPSQIITYASAHDNLTLYDKLVSTLGYNKNFQRHSELIQLNKLSAALLYTSQGALFMQSGEEFARTKYGDENSYQSSIAVNRLDWSRARENRDLVEYYKGLIAIRKAYPPLRDSSKKTADNIIFSNLPENVLAYTIPNLIEENPKWRMMAVVVNTKSAPVHLTLKAKQELPKTWTILANGKNAGLTPLGSLEGSTLIINPKEALIMIDEVK